MGSEPRSSPWKNLWKKLFEHVVALKNGPTAVCRNIDNELLLAFGNSTVDQIGIDDLEWQFVLK